MTTADRLQELLDDLERSVLAAQTATAAIRAEVPLGPNHGFSESMATEIGLTATMSYLARLRDKTLVS